MTLPPGFRLEDERPADAADIETLLDIAFGADRRAKRSYAYRRGVDSVVALRRVARSGPPTLCVAGADDPVAPAAGLGGCFGAVEVVPGRHAPAHDVGAARLSQVLEEFLARHCG